MDRSDQNYEFELGTVRKMLRAYSDPLGSLRAKEAVDRQFAACALTMRYAARPAGRAEHFKEAAVPARSPARSDIARASGVAVPIAVPVS